MTEGGWTCVEMHANLVVRYIDLPALLMDPTRMQGNGEDLRPLRAYVERAILEAGRGRRLGPLTYGHYEVVETLSGAIG